jgi:hypothetical protein
MATISKLEHDYKKAQQARFYKLNSDVWAEKYGAGNSNPLVKNKREIKNIKSQIQKSKVKKTTDELNKQLEKLLTERIKLYNEETDILLGKKLKLDLLNEKKILDSKGSILNLDTKIIECEYLDPIKEQQELNNLDKQEEKAHHRNFDRLKFILLKCCDLANVPLKLIKEVNPKMELTKKNYGDLTKKHFDYIEELAIIFAVFVGNSKGVNFRNALNKVKIDYFDDFAEVGSTSDNESDTVSLGSPSDPFPRVTDSDEYSDYYSE